MKLLLGLLVSLAISSAFALPARSPKDEVDVVEVPRGPQRSTDSEDFGEDDTDVDPNLQEFKGVVDTGAGYPFLAPLPHPFSFNLGFFDSFEDIFRRLRTRLWSPDSGESSEEGGLSLGLDPTKGANTTSVVKVVDGHKIEINDTVYGRGDGSNGPVFKFRVINIRPLESGEEIPEGTQEDIATEKESTTPIRDIEGKSDETTDAIEKGIASENSENEINDDIDDPESTTEAITTEMHDTVPHRLPSSDNNAVDNDSPVNPDELEVDADDNGATTEAVESLDDDVATLDEDNTNQIGNAALKSEKLSTLVDAENINDGSEDAEQSTKPPTDEDSERESNESIEVNQSSEDAEQEFLEFLKTQQQDALEGQQLEQLVDAVEDKLSMQEHLADEVETMLSANDEREQSSQGHHSLREDLSSSDDEEDDEDVHDISHQGVNSEWGSLDDKNILTNEIDVYQSVPIDLSNDIAINDIMADQGAPVNPDAEVFSVDEFVPGGAEFMAGRRFEALRDMK